MKMKKNEKGSVGVVVLTVTLLVVMAGGMFLFLRSSSTPKNVQTSPTPEQAKGDIDRSGVADEMDKSLVRSQLGCIKTEPCWQKTVGKTKDGDNPLYTFDLDLDNDGAITEMDVSVITP